MSSLLMIPIPAVKAGAQSLAARGRALLLALLGATALAFYGYQIHRLDSALSTYKDAARNTT